MTPRTRALTRQAGPDAGPGARPAAVLLLVPLPPPRPTRQFVLVREHVVTPLPGRSHGRLPGNPVRGPGPFSSAPRNGPCGGPASPGRAGADALHAPGASRGQRRRPIRRPPTAEAGALGPGCPFHTETRQSARRRRPDSGRPSVTNPLEAHHEPLTAPVQPGTHTERPSGGASGA